MGIIILLLLIIMIITIPLLNNLLLLKHHQNLNHQLLVQFYGVHILQQTIIHTKTIQIRDIAMKFAQSAILRQKQSMLDWSLLGDFRSE
eukprot:UN05664